MLFKVIAHRDGTRKTRTHRNNGDRNPPFALDRRDTNGNAWTVDPIAWWRLVVSSRNVAIYISSDYIARQTIKQFIITYHHDEQWPLLPYKYYSHYCLDSVHYYEDRFHIDFFIRSSHVWLSYSYNHLFITVGRALHRYRWGHEFKHCTGLIFFFFFFFLFFFFFKHYCYDFHIFTDI